MKTTVTTTTTSQRISNLLITFYILTIIIGYRCIDAQTTVRPYKFGFTIDEQQHRYEKRDERGIVMGEFGFITADGIYHVTVYATDEEGKFRILAMKNYPYESPPKTIDMVIKQKPKVTKSITEKPIVAVVTTTPRPKINFGQTACSGCFLKNKDDNSQIDDQTMKKDIRPLSKPLSPETGTSSNSNKTPGSNSASNTQNGNTPNTNANTNKQASPSLNSNKIPGSISNGASNTQTGYTPNSSTNTNTNTNNAASPVLPNFGNQGNVNSVAPSVSNPSKANSPYNPTNSAGSVGSKINGDGGGSRSGTGDSGDLYRFKYLLDYNGHTETGSRNGNKQGSFYSIGDDNIERTIEYVANEFGFQPRIRWRKLDPNEIKAKENTLKDYEFVWFKEQ